MSFLQGSLNFFTGSRAAHMGSHQYVDHAGKRNGRSVSGAKLWAEIEVQELNSSDSNLFSAEEHLLRRVAREIHDFLPEGIPAVELGPGTPNAFRKKMLLIMMALRSVEYICADASQAFLNDIARNKALSGFAVRPILDDFFESSDCYFDDDERSSLVCLLGGTIGNIVAPISDCVPEVALVSHLSRLAKKNHDGWLLVSCNSNCDGDEIKAYYNNHTLFHLNIFDRMAAELPIDGDFDPCAFAYEPLWIPSSGQLAHMAVVMRNMDFVLSGNPLSLKKGQKLHIKNSFKFLPSFFSLCCSRAGLDVVKTWTDSSLTNVFLLKKRSG